METQVGKNLHVALYARVSTEEQRQGQTIESQVDELKRFAEQKEWKVAGLYKDVRMEGSDFSETRTRPTQG